MKRIITFFIACYSLTVVFAQKNNEQGQINASGQGVKTSVPMPNSLVNVDFNGEGIGSFTGFGLKAVIGSNNTGFLVGCSLGSDSTNLVHYLMPKLGFQYGIYKGFYSNVNLCVPRIKEYSYDAMGIPMSTPIYTWSLRANIAAGYTFSFGKKRRLYLNVESSIAFINTDESLGEFSIFSGFGYRLGTPATTTYEGVKNVTTVPLKP